MIIIFPIKGKKSFYQNERERERQRETERERERDRDRERERERERERGQYSIASELYPSCEDPRLRPPEREVSPSPYPEFSSSLRYPPSVASPRSGKQTKVTVLNVSDVYRLLYSRFEILRQLSFMTVSTDIHIRIVNFCMNCYCHFHEKI
jgi:hypothetical protein